MSAVWNELWPYFVLILVGYLPNEIWRVLGLVLARGLDEDSEIVGVVARGGDRDPGRRHRQADPVFDRRARQHSAMRCGWRPRCAASLPSSRAKRSVFVGVAGRRSGAAARRLSVRLLGINSAMAAASFLACLGQHVRLFLLARRRLHRHAGLARDDVNMQVEHHLSAGAFVELLDGDAVGAENAFIAALAIFCATVA